MFTDARTLETGTTLEVDLCVVGAGPVGLSVVDGLVGTQHRVAIIESGGMEPSRRTRDLASGEAYGKLFGQRTSYLRRTRERAFGGLGEEWNGTCQPLDPEDFEARNWVADSGWPIGVSDLAPHYGRAFELLGVREAKQTSTDGWLADDESFVSSWLAHSPRPSIADRFRDGFSEADNVEVLTWANVVAIELDDAMERVTAVHVDCLDGPSLTVRARRFVLATGAVENARLLLLSDHQRSRGLGNEHDLVGRFFMDQISMRAGYVVLLDRSGRMGAYDAPLERPGVPYPTRAILRPTAELRARHQLLSSVISMSTAEEGDAGRLGPEVAGLAGIAADLGASATGHRGQPYLGRVTLRGEQAPNRASRVRLHRETDELNQRQARLIWRLDDHDVWSLATTTRLLGESIGRRRLGRVRQQGLQFWSRRHYTWSGHQSGTTRMSVDPTDGVVNTDCRVHDVENLYVAGSSVFPTCGSSGPMLTAVALSVRLGLHLRGALDAGEPG